MRQVCSDKHYPKETKEEAVASVRDQATPSFRALGRWGSQ